MSCQHSTPCNECPWRRKACPGWLGSDYSRAKWLLVASGESQVECHKSPSHECAGIAIFRANIGKRTKEATLALTADRAAVFATPQEFFDHHARIGVISSESTPDATLKQGIDRVYAQAT